MIQHVSEWSVECADCKQVSKIAIKMDMSDGRYFVTFEKHEHAESAGFYTTFYTAHGPTLEVLRSQVLPRQGYTVVTEG